MPESAKAVHLVLTRFNCRFVDRDFPVRTQPGWLESRFALFERYCVPTMKAQTSQNFEWLIYFDAETPPEYVRRAEGLIAGHPNFRLRFLEFYTGEKLEADLKDWLGHRCAWLLTTRLDNDDGLNVGFVERLQGEMSTGRREALNFPKGVVSGDGRIYISRQSSNAFLSLSEPYERFQTVLCAPHKDMNRQVPVRNVEAPPMWLQVIHDSNVSNKLRGRRILRSDIPAGFEVVAGLTEGKSESRLGAMIENVTMSAAWGCRDLAAHAVRRIRNLRR